jgi:hypothetical protein
MAVEININLNESNTQVEPNQQGREMLGESGSSSFGRRQSKALNGLSIQATKATIMEATNYATSNVGKWTGNSHNQQRMNNTSQGISLGILAYTNPGQAALSVITNVSTTLLNNAWEQKWEKRASSQNLSRLGYSNSGEVVGKKR